MFKREQEEKKNEEDGDGVCLVGTYLFTPRNIDIHSQIYTIICPWTHFKNMSLELRKWLQGWSAHLTGICWVGWLSSDLWHYLVFMPFPGVTQETSSNMGPSGIQRTDFFRLTSLWWAEIVPKSWELLRNYPLTHPPSQHMQNLINMNPKSLVCFILFVHLLPLHLVFVCK